MCLRATRGLCALWGQKLTGYLPPYSPSALLAGAPLMRYTVTTGDVSGPFNAITFDDRAALHAYVTSAEWQPSSSPAEVVLNSNEGQPFHSISPASAGDVRLCTEYLLTRESAGLQCDFTQQPQSLATQENAAVLSKPSSCSFSNSSDVHNFSVVETLQQMENVVRQHRALLAGAESLQTGVPLRLLLAELHEAETYLRWSQAAQFDNTSASQSSEADGEEADGSDSECCARNNSLDDGGESLYFEPTLTSNCTDAKALNKAEAAAALRSKFNDEVRSLQQQLSRRSTHVRPPAAYKANNSELRLSEAAVEMDTSSPAASLHCIDTAEAEKAPLSKHVNVGSDVPLITLVTSTQNSVASALKAAAVVWAAARSFPLSPTKPMHVLWCPAPGTSLSAVWWMVMMRTSSRAASRVGSEESNHKVETKFGSAVSSAPPSPGPAESGNQHIGTQPREATLSRGERHEGAVSVPPTLFHVCLTGPNTKKHFLKPWVSGYVNVKGRHSAPSLSPVAATIGAEFTASAADLSFVPLLLCYGCPRNQVRHFRSFFSSTFTGKGTQRIPILGAEEDPAESAAVVRAAVVMELRTEVPTTAVVIPADADTCFDGVLNPAPARVLTASEVPVSTNSATAAASERSSSDLSVSTGVTLKELSEPSETSLASFAPATRSYCTILTLATEHQRSASTLPLSSPAEVAHRLFDMGVLLPPFAQTSLSNSHVHDAPASNPPSDSSVASNSATTASHTVPGWCSLCFVAEQHTSALLRHLVQGHFKEPGYVGHSLDLSTRRGPTPSLTHALRIQDLLRTATRVQGELPPSPAPEMKEEKQVDGDDGVFRMCWRHGCGGFPLPLTATAGRSSPYTLPCFLFADLMSVMTAAERASVVQFAASCAATQRDSDANADANEETNEQGTERMAVARSRSSPSDTRAGSEEGQDAAVLRTAAKDATIRATWRVQRNVQRLLDDHDAADVGFRSVAAGNFLFLCRYPDHLQNFVVAGVMKPTN